MKRSLLAALLLCLAGAAGAAPTNTDGLVTFRVSTKTFSGSYAPKHVLAAWVTDGQSNFIKAIEKRAGSRQGYLYRYNAARGGWTNVDGVSSATINSHQTHNMSWNCRTTNNVVVTDGFYRVFVEFTESNAQGKTNQFAFYKGSVASTSTPPDATYFTNMLVVFAPYAHNIAVSQLSPTSGFANASVALQVRVTNLTATAESFRLVVSNLTRGTGVATQQVTGLAGSGATNIALTWNTAGLTAGVYQLKASAGPVTGETSVADNELTVAVQLRTPIHDVSVSQLSAPAMVTPGATSNVLVTASNAGDFVESFSVVLSDLSAGSGIRTAAVAGLVAAGSTNLTLPWSTAGAAIGFHVLQASIAAVSGEVSVADNSRMVTSLVASALRTNVLVARRSAWRYHDLGYDLTATPWRATNFYDGAWGEGLAPFGYGDPVATTNRYGSNPTNRLMTCYYRRSLFVDQPPLQLSGFLRRDDGAVVYLNGLPVLTTNMPVGTAPGFSTPASATVSGSDETNYFPFTLNPAALHVGRNVLAVEVHQVAPDSTDLSFDLELRAVEAVIPATTSFVAGVMSADTSILAGDLAQFRLGLTNNGNYAMACRVILVDAATGALLDTREVSLLPSGGGTELEFAWGPGVADVGSHDLEARLVVGSVTSVIADLPALSVADGAGAAPQVNVTGSIGGHVRRLALAGNLLLVGEGATLAVFDLLNPLQPVERSRLRLPGWIKGIAATGTQAYVACGAAGLHGVDLSDPQSPRVSAAQETSGDARGVALFAQHLYLADGVTGVRVFDVTTATALVQRVSRPTGGPAEALWAGEGILLVLDQLHGLLGYDAGAPSNPELFTQELGGSAGSAVLMADWYAYTVDQGGRFCVFDAVAVESPLYVTNLPGPAAGQALAATPGHLWVAAGATGLQVFDLASPVVPAHLQTLSLPGPAEDVVARGAVAYVACGDAGLAVVDIGAPASPALLRMIPAGARGLDAAVDGEDLWVAGGVSGLQHWSMTNAARPRLLQVITNAGWPYAVACATSGVVTVDAAGVLRTLVPGVTGSWSVAGSLALSELGPPRALRVAGPFAAVTDGRRVILADVQVPALPAETGRRMLDGFLFDLALTTSHLYVASGSHLEVLGLPDLATLGIWDGTGVVCGVEATGTTVRVSLGSAGWATLDMADPAHPLVMTTDPAEGAHALRSAGAWTVTSDRGRALTVKNTSVPLTPVLRGRFAPLVRSLRLSQRGSFVVAAEGAAGLGIIDLAPDDHDQDGLSDAWERALCDSNAGDALLGLANVNPQDDLDGDGTSNVAEFQAGTGALDGDSVFVVTAAQPAAGQLTLRWHSEPGRRYTIMSAASLTGPFTPLVTGIAATAPLNEQSVAGSGDEARYFIICTEL